MKENALDVLMYLFQNYIEGELEFVPDRDSLHNELVEAGFANAEIAHAFAWLDELANGAPRAVDPADRPASIRIYTQEETHAINTECRGFLLFLEQTQVISATVRELIIDRIMALNETDIDLQRLKWVVVMVLFNQPDQNANYDWIEHMVFEGTGSRYLH